MHAFKYVLEKPRYLEMLKINEKKKKIKKVMLA